MDVVAAAEPPNSAAAETETGFDALGFDLIVVAAVAAPNPVGVGQGRHSRRPFVNRVPTLVDGGEVQGASFGHSVDKSEPAFVAARIGCTLFVVLKIVGPVIKEVGGIRDGTTYAETDAIVVAVAVAAGVKDRRRQERRATLQGGSRCPRLGWPWLLWRRRSSCGRCGCCEIGLPRISTSSRMVAAAPTASAWLLPQKEGIGADRLPGPTSSVLPNHEKPTGLESWPASAWAVGVMVCTPGVAVSVVAAPMVVPVVVSWLL